MLPLKVYLNVTPFKNLQLVEVHTVTVINYTPNINEDHDDYHYHGFGSYDSSLLIIIMVFIINY